MTNRIVLPSLLLVTLALAACSLNGDGSVPPAGVAPLPAIVNTPTMAPAEGGTYRDPVINITASCPEWGRYIFDMRYSPPDLQIIEASVSGIGVCTVFGGGVSHCELIQDPYWIGADLIDVSVTYDPGSGVSSQRSIPITPPACPAHSPEAELAAIDCLAGGRVGVTFQFTENPIFDYTTFLAACYGDETCQGTGSAMFDEFLGGDFETNTVSFAGPAPTNPLAPLRFYYRFDRQPEAEDNYMVVFPDFYTRYRAACPVLPPPPQASATPEESGGQPACSSYTSQTDCENAPGGTCKWDGSACYHP
jgi:hypothetical protein